MGREGALAAPALGPAPSCLLAVLCCRRLVSNIGASRRVPSALQVDSLKFSRKNEEARPFEPGGEAALEGWAAKSNCSLFVLGSHQKKRPHNLVLGR